MTSTTIPAFPFAEALRDARLDGIRLEGTADPGVILDFRELRHTMPSEWVEQHGAPAERVRGVYAARRLRFSAVNVRYLEGLYRDLGDAPPDDPCRILTGMLTWQLSGERQPSYRLMHGSDRADLWFSAGQCQEEPRREPAVPFDFVRAHSPAPPLAPGLVPVPRAARRTYAGDPVGIRLGNRRYNRRLFVGSLEEQGGTRPAVDAVLNLGEAPSRWVRAPLRTSSPADRWVEKGEGSAGMSIAEIRAEAEWVIERLQTGQAVLIHCVAGFNRSTTVAAAVLILLEGLSAEAALARVREQHAWARPDATHWLRLKYLAGTEA